MPQNSLLEPPIIIISTSNNFHSDCLQDKKHIPVCDSCAANFSWYSKPTALWKANNLVFVGLQENKEFSKPKGNNLNTLTRHRNESGYYKNWLLLYYTTLPVKKLLENGV